MKRFLHFLSLGLLLLSCDKPVEEVPVSSVSLSQSTAEMLVGETIRLTATVLPDDAKDKSVTWASSKTSVATVSSSGEVTAVAEGSATITASAGGKSATCTVTVSRKDVPVASVSLSQETAEMFIGETVQLKATVLPDDAKDKSVTWASSKQSVATVSGDGLVTALAEGTTTVTASAGGKSATCTVTVSKKNIPVSSVTLDRYSLALVEGEYTVLVATVSPSDATDKDVEWSSSRPAVASVDGNGTVRALAEGETVVTASAGGKSATCTVTVSKKVIEVTSVTLSQETADMIIGEKVQLKATVLPSDATDRTVTWASSRQSVATVSDDGLVTALAEGTATITASAGSKSATCSVTVSKENVPVTSVTLDRSSVIMEEGQYMTLVATVSPADATDKTVKWKSSSPAVASVDENGTIRALAEGVTVVTASAGGYSATCAVTVVKKYVPVLSVTLDRTSVTLEKGQSTTLVATVSPADATDKTVTWTNSDDTVISLVGGKVTALKEGTSTVTAVAGDKSASCVVTVAKTVVPVTSVTLDRTSVTLEKGSSIKLVATVSPSDATDRTVTWSSSDVSVASVDQDGTVRAVKGGTATVTAKAGEKSATCRVTVVTPVTGVTLDHNILSLEVGQNAVLTATIYPEDATDKAVIWSSSDASVATVGDTGVVTALKKGSAVITAKAGDKSATCTVNVSNVQFGISVTSVSVPGAGGGFEVTVRCSGTYHLDSKSDWVEEKSVSGKTHTFTVKPNPDSSARNGFVVFCDDEGTCLSCSVQQAAGGNLSLTPSSVEISAKGGTFEVRVACSSGYHIDSMPSWISDVSDPGSIQVHRFQVAENAAESERSGVVVFCDDHGTCMPCSVKQKAVSPDQSEGDNENLGEGDPINW